MVTETTFRCEDIAHYVDAIVLNGEDRASAEALVAHAPVPQRAKLQAIGLELADLVR